MERRLRLADGKVIKDGERINILLKERRGALDRKRRVSPYTLLRGVSLDKAGVALVKPKTVGVLELRGSSLSGRQSVFENVLHDIPDLTIDLTPTSGALPRNSRRFILEAPEKTLQVEVLFDALRGEYWRYFGDEEKIDSIVSQNFLETVRSVKHWKRGHYDAWGQRTK